MSNSSLFRFLLVAALVGGVGYLVVSSMLSDPGITEPGVTADTPDAEDRDSRGVQPEAPQIAPPSATDTHRAEAPSVATGSGDAQLEPGSGGSGLAGLVVNKSGQPVVGAEVTLYVGTTTLAMPFPAARRATGRSTRTDDEGLYVLDGLNGSNNYVIVVDHPDYAQKELPGVVLRENDYQQVNQIVLDEGARVYGTILSATGTPIAGAEVELWNSMASGFQRVEERKPFRATTTDATGNYEIKNISFNSMEVVARSPGYATMSKSNATLFTQIEDRQVDFELVPAFAIEGSVVDETGVPVRDAHLEAFQMGKPPTSGSSRSSAVSRADGQFRLADLADGSYNLMVRARGYSDKQQGAGIEAGASNIRIVLERRGGVAGRVLTKAGAPVSTFTVRIKRRHGGGEAVPTDKSLVVPSGDGSYQIDDLDPGEYVVEGEADGYAPTDSNPFNVERGKVTQNVAVYLSLGASLSGFVANAAGEPVPGALITIRQNNFVPNPILDLFRAMPNAARQEERSTRSGNDGSFTLKNLVPGTFQVEISRNGLSPQALNDVALVEDQQRDLGRVIMSSGGTILGRCLDVSGRPFSEGTVNCTTKDGGMKNTRPDQNGNFEFRSLPTAEYTLSLNPDRLDGEAVNPFMRVVYGTKTEQKVMVYDERQAEVVLRLPPAQGK